MFVWLPSSWLLCLKMNRENGGTMMDLEAIERLVAIMDKSSLVELSVEDGETKITMSRKGQTAQVSLGEDVHLAKPIEGDEEESFISSPIVGTFYSAASPDIPAFVRVGDVVKKGQPVCIVEAMKLMNELNCDFDCEIEAVLVSNEQKVEYGQPLFRVRRLD